MLRHPSLGGAVMQSSSSGTLSTVGLLACAAAAGVLAARKWPEGPPPQLPLRAWDWLAAQVASPIAQSEARDYGPAPQFEIGPGQESRATPDGLALPDVEIPPASPASPAENAAPPTRPAPSLEVRPASDSGPVREPEPPEPPDESPKTSPFWPKDLSDLLPGLGAGGANSKSDSASPAAFKSPPAPPAPGARAASAEPSIEWLVRRLDEMGAVVMRLERQRGQTAGYVFRCELPFPQNPRYHRFFQAVDADPARAVQRVTRDVEAWKAAERR
jgi:hypothetical protein